MEVIPPDRALEGVSIAQHMFFLASVQRACLLLISPPLGWGGVKRGGKFSKESNQMNGWDRYLQVLGRIRTNDYLRRGRKVTFEMNETFYPILILKCK